MTIDIKYENYSVKDFLEDDLFLQWQLAPTETLDEFWKQVLQQYPHQEANLSDAVRTLHSVTINHVSLSRREEDKMLQNIYARYRRHRVRRFIYWSTSVAASLILLFLLVSPLRDFTGEKVNVMLTDVQSVRLDTIQDVQLIIGEKKTIAMAEDADISWTKEDEIEVNGRSSNSTYKSRIDADVTYSTLLVPYGKRSFLTLRDGTKVWINSGTEVRFPVNMEGKERSIYVDGEIYIEVYLLPLIFVACREQELKRSGKGILAHRYLHFFGMNTFDGEINHLSGAHNLSQSVQRWTLVICYQAIVRIIYFILNGKTRSCIHC